MGNPEFEVDMDRLETYAQLVARELDTAVAALKRATIGALAPAMQGSLTASAEQELSGAWEASRNTATKHAEWHPEALHSVVQTYRQNEQQVQIAVRNFFEGRIK